MQAASLGNAKLTAFLFSYIFNKIFSIQMLTREKRSDTLLPEGVSTPMRRVLTTERKAVTFQSG
jgi:hypothetical protein